MFTVAIKTMHHAIKPTRPSPQQSARRLLGGLLLIIATNLVGATERKPLDVPQEARLPVGLETNPVFKKTTVAVETNSRGQQEMHEHTGLRGAFNPGVPTPGTVIKDCDVCPELVVLPRGSFEMGSPKSEPERDDDEGPQRRVTINYTLAVGKYEVTQGQWSAVMRVNPSSLRDCGNNCPVETVSWDDVQQYLKKLNKKSGKKYRLLTEAEWEYAARGGTTTPFSTGKTITTAQANFHETATYNGMLAGVYRGRTLAVGSFEANAFGLHDMHGNVWEWVQDIWQFYGGAPTDGSAREVGDMGRVVRGGGWYGYKTDLRSASRSGKMQESRDVTTGFRVARTF